MSCRGLHIAIDRPQAVAAQGLRGTPLVDFVQNLEQELFGGPWAHETDKAWDAIHRCLTDGTLRSGSPPLSYFILGGARLPSRNDRIITLVSPEQAKAAIEAARAIDEAWMRDRYLTLNQTGYEYPLSDTDCEYTWAYFEALAAFYQRAAEAGRWIIFDVDQ